MVEDAVQARTLAPRGERERFTVRLAGKEEGTGWCFVAVLCCEPPKVQRALYECAAQLHGTRSTPC